MYLVCVQEYLDSCRVSAENIRVFVSVELHGRNNLSVSGNWSSTSGFTSSRMLLELLS